MSNISLAELKLVHWECSAFCLVLIVPRTPVSTPMYSAATSVGYKGQVWGSEGVDGGRVWTHTSGDPRGQSVTQNQDQRREWVERGTMRC